MATKKKDPNAPEPKSGDPCPECDGTGLDGDSCKRKGKLATATKHCPACKGTGKVP